MIFYLALLYYCRSCRGLWYAIVPPILISPPCLLPGRSQTRGGTLVCDNISLENNVTGQNHPAGTGEIQELFLDNDVDPDAVYLMASFSSQTLASDWDALITIKKTR